MIKFIMIMRSNGTIFPNEIINALKVASSIKKRESQHVSLLAPMQSGKTGSIKYLCNTILPKN